MSVPEPLARAVTAALAPLRFATRDNFARLDRLLNLESTIDQAVSRMVAAGMQTHFAAQVSRINAIWCAKHTPMQQRLMDLLTQLENFESSPVNNDLQYHETVLAAPTRQAAQSKPPKKLSAPRPTTKQSLTIDTPVLELRGVGERIAQLLAARELFTVGDLLRFLPRRYQGQSSYQAIGSVSPDEVVSVEGMIQTVSDRFVRGRHTLEVTLADPTGQVTLMWFRVPHRHFVASFKRGSRMRAAGMVKRFRTRLQINHPEVGLITDGGVDVEAGADDEHHASSGDAIIPIYLAIDGVHPAQLRRLMGQALEAAALVQDPLPQALRERRQLMELGQALHQVHLPPPDSDLDALQVMATPAQKRLIYDELLLLQLKVLTERRRFDSRQQATPLKHAHGLVELARKILPFEPTGAQQRVLLEMAADLMGKRPMQRLLQGDVGSGKTAVALSAAACAAKEGLQVALMAPTELLAEQHARTAKAILAPEGLSSALLTGHTPPAQRRQLLQALKQGMLDVVIGTHALIQNDIDIPRLGLAIVDEQHRFGVAQRARLAEVGRAGTQGVPHLLVMTATPIPRTLALTAYGDLDVSVIDELPPGRTPIKTQVFRDGERQAVYQAVREQVAQGRQAYVVFPLVEDSDKEGMSELRAATSSIEELAQGPLSGIKLGLLHGRLNAAAKEAVMQAFLAREMDVLVATTVIEVGIDVPNATVMVIEHAERFGLSQLHQLRGRVGRGAAQSQCLLLARARPQHDSWRRLMMMAQTNDGFRIAEEDLAMRGPGDFMGTRQSGLPILSVANLARDGALLRDARQDAAAMLQKTPELQGREFASLKALLAQYVAKSAHWLLAG